MNIQTIEIYRCMMLLSGFGLIAGALLRKAYVLRERRTLNNLALARLSASLASIGRGKCLECPALCHGFICDDCMERGRK